VNSTSENVAKKRESDGNENLKNEKEDGVWFRGGALDRAMYEHATRESENDNRTRKDQSIPEVLRIGYPAEYGMEKQVREMEGRGKGREVNGRCKGIKENFVE
jgi:hypothetical protein